MSQWASLQNKAELKPSGINIMLYEKRKKIKYILHQVLGLCGFLGPAKIRMNQIRSTKVISNQKLMSEGITSLM